MSKINKFLKEKNLIKVGSCAPPEIQKEIYKQCVLTGNVKNINHDNMIYNFMNTNNK
jgi:hypothetical protein